MQKIQKKNNILNLLKYYFTINAERQEFCFTVVVEKNLIQKLGIDKGYTTLVLFCNIDRGKAALIFILTSHQW